MEKDNENQRRAVPCDAVLTASEERRIQTGTDKNRRREPLGHERRLKHRHRSVLQLFRSLIPAAVCAATAHIGAAGATGTTSPHEIAAPVSGTVEIETLEDWAYETDDSAAPYPKIEPSVTVALAAEWSIFVQAVIEPVRTVSKIEDGDFNNLGLLMNDLRLEYSDAGLRARAGKLKPNFGIAWNRTAGIYPQEYRIGERIGAMAGYTLSNMPAGKMTVSAGSFLLDANVLDRSVLSGRDDPEESAGDLNIAEIYTSSLVSIDGSGAPGRGIPGYHLSVMHQDARRSDARDGTAFAIGLHTSVDLGHGVTFRPLTEYVRHRNFAGVAGQDREYVTIASGFAWNGWDLAVAWTGRDTKHPDAEDDRDNRFRLSGGYVFDSGLRLEAGWKVADESHIESRTFAAKASYTLSF